VKALLDRRQILEALIKNRNQLEAKNRLNAREHLAGFVRGMCVTSSSNVSM
jgi:hypothetical protein